MAVFSTNQARHFYVVKKLISDTALPSKEGDIKIVIAEDSFKFLYYGSQGLQSSDSIPIKNITSIKTLTNESIKYPKYEIKLDTNVNGGNPLVADYILRISVDNYLSKSDNGAYLKFAAVHATSGMTASNFYKEMAISLLKNFSRESTPILNVGLTTSTGDEIVTLKTNFSKTYTGLFVIPNVAPWRLGKNDFKIYNLTISAVPINDGTSESSWGVITKKDSNVTGFTTIKNGMKIADLEWFCMGERGDTYRGANYPDNIDTTYLVDPKESYDSCNIHYFYQGENEAIQKSDKDITLVATTANTAHLTGIVNAIEDSISPTQSVSPGGVVSPGGAA